MLVTVAAVLAGCNAAPSAPDNAMPVAAASTPAPGATRTAPPGPTRAEAQQALEFIVSRLDEMDLSRVDKGESYVSKSLTWTPSDISLKSGGWSWTERTIDLIVDAGGLVETTTTDHYRLDPKRLSYPAIVKKFDHRAGVFWTVTIECLSTDCFEVRGKKHVTTQLVYRDREVAEEATNAMRQSNSWWFSDENTARRIARAVDVVLQYEGAQKQRY